MHSAHGKDFVLTDYAKNLIRFKARQLSRCPGFCSSDVDDLQQQLWLTLTKQADQFDPARASLDTFIDRVVNPGVAMIVRDRQRLKRANGFHARSLDEIARGEAEPLSAVVSNEDLARRGGVERLDEAARREDAEAIGQALMQMPQELRDLCRRVMGGSISSVARDLGASRRQVRKGLAAARVFLEQAGFGLD